jgi:hypothetical protein
VNAVMASMQNTPTAAYLAGLSFHERLMLASLVKCIKREGVEEIKWGDVSSFFDIPYFHLPRRSLVVFGVFVPI